MGRESSSPSNGVTVVCVYNDPEVLQNCLRRSIEAYSGDHEVELVAVDNTHREFTSAGAALNHGARLAQQELLVFAHQDVYLHSIDLLVSRGRVLASSQWGLLGANGFTGDGNSVGRMRDRVLVIGAPAATPVEVDSVDEVLFMVLREVILQYPLTEDPLLAWHAYAVEYGLRMRQLAKRVGAVDLAITHNSLTINLDKLDEAHEYVGKLYPDFRPIQTTCGMVGATHRRWRDIPIVRRHGWRARWFRQSIQALRARQRIHVPVILTDISHDVDLLPFSNDSPLHLFNLDSCGGFAEYASEPLSITRNRRPVIMQAVQEVSQLASLLQRLEPADYVLVTDLSLDDLETIGTFWKKRRCVIGYQTGVFWIFGGADASELPHQWSRPHSVPFGFRALSSNKLPNHNLS